MNWLSSVGRAPWPAVGPLADRFRRRRIHRAEAKGRPGGRPQARGPAPHCSLDGTRAFGWFRLFWCVLAICSAPLFAADSDDVILRAMRGELERSRSLKFANLE